MLVFGDRSERVDPRERLARLTRDVAAGEGCPELRTAALVEAGMLAQGLADAEFAERGEDDPSRTQDLALALVRALADPQAFDSAAARAAAEALAARPLPAEVTCKVPEGFSVYGVYPEAYRRTAARLRLRRPLVVGLRSIGLALAAAAAAGAGAARIVTLRPTGHPFRREVRASARLRDLFAAHPGEVLIVDEGPGLSGSSFNAAADLLCALGIDEARLVFMPSHPGDLGPEASDAHRARWSRARRAPATLDGLLAQDPIGRWFEDLTGPVRRVEDLSGGAWRDELPAAIRPPAWRLQERRKFRITAERGVFLARFAGLGPLGAGKLDLAGRLHAAGFGPEPLGLRRGFLLERWVDGEPLVAGQGERGAILERIGAYLAFRAVQLPGPGSGPGSGADAAELMEMTRVNAGLVGGEPLGRAVAAALPPPGRLAAAAWPICVDGRLHPWEWRRGADGRLWKTDALDHAVGHDLIGHQDIAWDVAGAVVEFGLSPQEAAFLSARVGAARGRVLEPDLLAAYRLAYCAFQAGLWTYAASDPQEAVAARVQVARYREGLSRP